jgi:uncharacterized membrane protein (UPF0127 family)
MKPGPKGRSRYRSEKGLLRPRTPSGKTSSASPAATLELAAGTAERLNLRVGDRVLQRIFGTAP